MAEAPAGSRLIPCGDTRFPVLACDTTYLLPGVPALFRVQLEAVMPELPGTPVTLRQLFLNARESEIAATLDAVALKRPHVAIGSYPTWGEEADHRVKLTIEHVDAKEVSAAFDELKAALGSFVIREG
jgi:molybdopterin-biosynthesis enzyme MoeA-like protein